MTKSNAKKVAQLKMPFGTANGRLRKMILFNLLCRLNENVCFVCHKKIQSVDLLSIEHKIPWLGNDTKLFWDLENIAFSHLSCNIKNKRSSGDRRTKNGKIFCTGCKQWMEPSMFTKNSYELCGYHGYCKKCRKENNAW
jgi:hypothetical protein